MTKETKSKKSLWYKIPLIIVGSIIGLFTIVWGGLNIFKFAIYSQYFDVMTKLGTTPGLNDNFVPQGICVSEENNVYLMSGYQADKSASRIYITDGNKNDRYVSLLKEDGSKFTGHSGGIATTGDYVYVANSSKIYILDLNTLLNKETKTMTMDRYVEVNNSASFVFTNDEYLYVGEFHDGGQYVTDHVNETSDGTYYAICSKYAITDILSSDSVANPVLVYAIRNKVQGFAINDIGEIVLSTSYGLSNSIFYKYEANSANDSGKTFDGAPLYYLDNYSKTLVAPPMSEDMDYSNGQWITYMESACDKYIFGKFFFATYFYSFDL